MSSHPITFYDRLIAELAQQKLTKSELARRLEMNVNSIDAWKRRGGEPSAATLLRIARAIEVDPWWLLTGDGIRTPKPDAGPAIDIDSDIAALRQAAAKSDDARRALHYLARSLRKP